MKLAILRAVRALQPHAYGNTILQHLRDQGVNASYGSLYATLERLEAEGLVTCRNDEPTPERGDRPKRYVELTESGLRELEQAADRVQPTSVLSPIGFFAG